MSCLPDERTLTCKYLYIYTHIGTSSIRSNPAEEALHNRSHHQTKKEENERIMLN